MIEFLFELYHYYTASVEGLNLKFLKTSLFFKVLDYRIMRISLSSSKQIKMNYKDLKNQTKKALIWI